MNNLILFTVLLFISTNSFSPTTAQEAVLDGYGIALEVRSKYYIKSAVNGSGGGGVTVGATGAQRCPVTVVQEIVDVQNGVACTFHPANPEDTVIRESSSINIKFEDSIGCASSTVWRVGEYEESVGLRYVEIQGALGNPGCNTSENWFKIEKGIMSNSYKLVFNPNDVCVGTPDTTADLGVFFSEGLRPLALTNGTAFNVKFWKHQPYVASY